MHFFCPNKSYYKDDKAGIHGAHIVNVVQEHDTVLSVQILTPLRCFQMCWRKVCAEVTVSQDLNDKLMPYCVRTECIESYIPKEFIYR